MKGEYVEAQAKSSDTSNMFYKLHHQHQEHNPFSHQEHVTSKPPKKMTPPPLPQPPSPTASFLFHSQLAIPTGTYEMKHSNPATELVGQNLIKLISNLCFSVFIFSVLIFTVIAITYQPPDPWLESTPTLTRLFTPSLY